MIAKYEKAVITCTILAVYCITLCLMSDGVILRLAAECISSLQCYYYFNYISL